MKKTIKILLLFGLIFNLADAVEAQQRKRSTKNSQSKIVQKKKMTAEQIAKKFLPSVVLIVCEDGKGNYTQGSGFFIRQGLILTNYHVIEDMVRGKVKTVANENKNKEWWIEKILYSDSKNDLALLSIKDIKIEIDEIDGVKLKQPITTYEFLTPTLNLSDSDKIEIGETIYVLSNPVGLRGTISQGIISGGLRKIDGIDLLQIDASISSGSSGGAVLNTKGEVIGIATGSLSKGQNLNFAVPTLQIKSFLKSYDNDSNDKDYTFAEISDVPNAWQEYIVIKPIPIQRGLSTGLGQGNQIKSSDTEEKPEMLYARITQRIKEKLQNSSVSKTKYKAEINNISFSQCFMDISVSNTNLETNQSWKDSYSVDLKFVQDSKETTFGKALDFDAIFLHLNKRVIEKTIFNDGGEKYSLVDEITIPVLNENVAGTTWADFSVIGNLCANKLTTFSKEQPSMEETTTWLTNKIEGTGSILNGLKMTYLKLRFSQCELSLETELQIPEVKHLEIYTSSLKFLQRIEVEKNKYGNWAVWLKFSKNFNVDIEKSGYFRQKENQKRDQIVVFPSSQENAKRVASGFSRLLELCSEESKEPF